METKDNNKGQWRWPEQGSYNPDHITAITGLPSPYELELPPMCYPGTPLDAGILGVVLELMRKQLNGIGFHTPGQMGEGGFDGTQDMERRAIWMVAGMLGGTPEEVDGYFCGGGTEANLQGLYIGRQFLRGQSDPNHKGIAILCTPLAHYSIFFKGTNILGLTNRDRWDRCHHCGRPHLLSKDEDTEHLHLVGVTEAGEMNLEHLHQVFLTAFNEGYRQFMVVATAGTCLMGSIDPIRGIGQWITKMRQEYGVEFYFHVDASFGGFTIPFMDQEGVCPIGFSVPEVNSITVDADKMGHLPYPAGIFMCRKGLQELVGLDVAYIRGHREYTVSGSRSVIAPVLAWEYYQRIGVEGHRNYVHKCLETRDYLLSLLKERFRNHPEVVRALPCSPFVNFLPLVINIEGGGIPDRIGDGDGALAPYHLRSDGIPTDPMDPFSCPQMAYKLCIMPHHTHKHMRRFVYDLEKVLRSEGRI